MAQAKEIEGQKAATPPYISFQTVKTVAKHLKEHGTPNQIDRFVLNNLSGGVVGQVLPALKFLGLTNEANQPTPQLKKLIDSYDTDAWPTVLGEIIRTSYKPIIALNLETASPLHFTQKFKETYPGTDDVQRKSITFFVNAVREAKIPVSSYLLKDRKPRSGPTKKRTAKPAGSGGQSHDKSAAEIAAAAAAAAAAAKKPSEMLLSYLDKDMKQPEQDAVWTLLKYFRAKGQ